MEMDRERFGRTLTTRLGPLMLGLLWLAPAQAPAQDSVASTPGGSDALSPQTDPVMVRYALDLVPITSSWGNAYQIGPVLKSSADPDPMFATLAPGSAAVSPDHLTAVAFASTSFQVWSSPGQGVHPTANTAPGSVALTGFDRQFGLALNGLSANQTSVIGALVGQVSSEPSRIYVTRWVGMTSRGLVTGPDSNTLSIGAIDAAGNLLVRADGFNADPQFALIGDNILHVDLPLVQNVNTAFLSGGQNTVGDAISTSFVVNDGQVTFNTPAILPESLGATASAALLLDFANAFSVDGTAAAGSHLGAGVAAHRGNPSFSTRTEQGGVGTVASLGKATTSGPTNAINVFGVDSSGQPLSPIGAVLPSPISDGVVSRNASGQAGFQQYLSQTSFRGGNGQAAVGFDPDAGALLVAATATDPTDGEFVAVCRLPAAQAPQWTIAAYVAKPVLDGANGATIGTIGSGTPVSMSAPGTDSWGNIYLVGEFVPTAGPTTTALFKLVNATSFGGGYQAELLLQEGQTIAGANSGRSYTIDRISLGDSDSVASGTLFSSGVLAPSMPGASVTRSDDPNAFGGIVVTAGITYDNGGTPESYDVALFLGPGIGVVPFCPGDADGSGFVDFDDVISVLSNWLTTPPAGSAGPGDANNDGIVNFDDVITVLGNFLNACP